MDSAPPSYKGHRYPVEIIAHCVWLHFRFPLSFREVEELMLERGVKYLWRAVEADGNVLDILVRDRRDTAAARRFFHKLLKRTCSVPRVIVTDKLRSYGAAHREIMPSAEHRAHKGLNNRAENSHQPTRQREHAMKGFRSTGGAQRFLSAFSGISPHFRPRRHLMTATRYRTETTTRFAIRDEITGATDQPIAA
ncbi:transposase [Streptomyces sp. NPDC001933]|uniref:transposase n=1 Tax=Streptomyces sp. NPDC001933 TaxID=3364626 RepID=UPI0036C31293